MQYKPEALEGVSFWPKGAASVRYGWLGRVTSPSPSWGCRMEALSHQQEERGPAQTPLLLGPLGVGRCPLPHSSCPPQTGGPGRGTHLVMRGEAACTGH